MARTKTSPRPTPAEQALCLYPSGVKKSPPLGSAQRAIREYQSKLPTMIEKLPMQRLIREIVQDNIPKSKGIRFQSTAIMALHEAAEAHLVSIFEEANFATILRGGKALMPRDYYLAWRMATYNSRKPTIEG